MKRMITLVLAVSAVYAGSDFTLQYDDGAPEWLTWTGTYRGVWFDTEDFLPGSSGFLLEEAVLWLSDPVDCYVEVWNGTQLGPAVLLDRTMVPGGSMIVVYSPPLDCDSDFWIVLNTSPSGGGTPRIMGDGSPPAVNHSFYSDDFLTWEPWSDGQDTGDYLIRGSGEFQTSLEGMTWGALKSVF